MEEAAAAAAAAADAVAKRDHKKRRRQAEKPARDAAAARAAKDAAVVLCAEQAAAKRAKRVQNQRATQAQQAAARERQTGKETMASTAKAAARTAKNKAPCKRPVPQRRSHDQHTTQAGQRDALARNVAKEEAKRKLAEKPEDAAAARKKAKRLAQKSRRGAKQGVRSQSEEVKLSTEVAREEERSAVPTVADRFLANRLVVDMVSLIKRHADNDHALDLMWQINEIIIDGNATMNRLPHKLSQGSSAVALAPASRHTCSRNSLRAC